jgi:hypothetical protein
MTPLVGWMVTRFISDFALFTQILLTVGTRTRRRQDCAGNNRKASRLGGSCLRNGSAFLSRDPPNHLSLPKTEELNQKNNNQGNKDGIDGWHHHAVLIGLSRAIPPTARCAFIPHFGIFVKSHFPSTMKDEGCCKVASQAPGRPAPNPISGRQALPGAQTTPGAGGCKRLTRLSGRLGSNGDDACRAT